MTDQGADLAGSNGRPAPAATVSELAPGVRAALTSRHGGVSRAPYASLNLSTGTGDDPAAVGLNRRLAAAACGLPAGALVWMRQVHGTDVGQVTDPGRASAVAPAAAAARDASFTALLGVALGVLAADCPAVLLADPRARIVGAAHSGREGTAGGVVPALVAAMTAAGADPGRMLALIGPAICGGCYEVPAAMRDQVAAAVPAAACWTRAGTPGLDLTAGITAQLTAAGMTRIRADGRCTAEDQDLYSYRRDGRTGRFACLVWLAP